MTTIQDIEEFANENGFKVYRHYSGRYMYGGECIGVSHDSVDAMIEAAALAGLPRPRVDSLGKGFIASWPSIPDPSKEDAK